VSVKQVTGVVYRSTNTEHVCTYSRGPQSFQKSWRATTKFWAPEGWHEANYMPGYTVLGATIQKLGAKDFCFRGVDIETNCQKKKCSW